MQHELQVLIDIPDVVHAEYVRFDDQDEKLPLYFTADFKGGKLLEHAVKKAVGKLGIIVPGTVEYDSSSHEFKCRLFRRQTSGLSPARWGEVAGQAVLQAIADQAELYTVQGGQPAAPKPAKAGVGPSQRQRPVKIMVNRLYRSNFVPK